MYLPSVRIVTTHNASERAQLGNSTSSGNVDGSQDTGGGVVLAFTIINIRHASGVSFKAVASWQTVDWLSSH